MTGISHDETVYLNGRFHQQQVTGVQRYAIEIIAAMDRLVAERGSSAQFVMITPRGLDNPALYHAIQRHSFGRLKGHLWEQLELPFRTQGGLLINLANAGPVFQRRQLIVLHDANIYAMPETYGVPFRLWHKALHRLYLRFSARIATVSRFSASEIARYLNIDPAEILGPTLEGADHILRAEADFTILPRHGLVADKYVLAVGSSALHKNLSALSATVVELAKRGLTLAVVGSGDPRIFTAIGADYLQSAKHLGRVTDAELRALYERAACFVFPSRYEGFGIPPIEAMACGCPVVASTAGAVMEACGDAALYCDPEDQKEFASTVTAVIETPDLARTLRDRSRIRAQELTWEKAAYRLLELVTQLRPPANA